MSEINLVTIRGERKTFTHWMTNICRRNLTINTDVQNLYRWKHGYFLEKDIRKYQEDHLILITFKNIHSWLKSMFDQKWHFPPQIKKLNFDKFIRTEYWAICDDNWFPKHYGVKRNEELKFERDIKTGERHKNLIKLWNSKHNHWLEMKEAGYNVEFISYDTMLKNPENKFNEIIEKYKLKVKENKIIIDKNYLGRRNKAKFDKIDYYLNKKYIKEYDNKQLDFIESQIDKELLRKLEEF